MPPVGRSSGALASLLYPGPRCPGAMGAMEGPKVISPAISQSLSHGFHCNRSNFLGKFRGQPDSSLKCDLVDQYQKVASLKLMCPSIFEHSLYKLWSQRFDCIPNQAQPPRPPPVMQKTKARIKSQSRNSASPASDGWRSARELGRQEHPPLSGHAWPSKSHSELIPLPPPNSRGLGFHITNVIRRFRSFQLGQESPFYLIPYRPHENK